MVRLFVRHPVADYASWRKVYDEFDLQRRPMGVTGHAVYQGLGSLAERNAEGRRARHPNGLDRPGGMIPRG